MRTRGCIRSVRAWIWVLILGIVWPWAGRRVAGRVVGPRRLAVGILGVRVVWLGLRVLCSARYGRPGSPREAGRWRHRGQCKKRRPYCPFLFLCAHALSSDAWRITDRRHLSRPLRRSGRHLCRELRRDCSFRRCRRRFLQDYRRDWDCSARPDWSAQDRLAGCLADCWAPAGGPAGSAAGGPAGSVAGGPAGSGFRRLGF